MIGTNRRVPCGTLFAFIVCVLLLVTAKASAAGGPCPSGANYLNATGTSLVTLSSLGVTSCYYIAANGSDSNDGLSEASGHPWLHAPGMGACTGTCASTTPSPGEGFILRGGDTWHFGNRGASPYTGAIPSCSANGGTCNWVILWSGSAGSPIYFGIDQTWYSGSEWARPILNGDNPISTSAVASCTYDETKNTTLVVSDQSYVIRDNFEFTGTCWNGNEVNANEAKCCTVLDQTLYSSSSQGNNITENLYLHGWTHVKFSCSLSGGEPTGSCSGAEGISGPSNSSYGGGDAYLYDVVDGADSDGSALEGMSYGCYLVAYSVFRYNSNVICNNAHVVHDDLIEYIVGPGDQIGHGNSFLNNVEWAATGGAGTSVPVNAFYNIVLRHLWYTGYNEVTFWTDPQAGITDYEFNFLMYDICPTSNSANCTSNGNFYVAVNPLGSSTMGTVNIFNQTWVPNFSGIGVGGPTSPSGTINWYNNHCIMPGVTTPASCYSVGNTTMNYLTDIMQTPAAATAQGYTASETYAYSPTASNNATVRAGTNEEAFCSALTGSSDLLLQAAGQACQNGTTFACAYNTSTHAVTCPAQAPSPRPSTGKWDIGAYQNTGGALMPPTNVKATAH